ncbi:hypothetical protein DPX16_5379 [Anabarilius grahami]|uniref:Uncharacterized protein n=1 Tax=Anabarilius grahami TaxID=495550 RepID=A0A3N0Y5Y1_ANAGA|nr:hypothetical protein DPX16_5379 [Anabarilius grahami]
MENDALSNSSQSDEDDFFASMKTGLSQAGVREHGHIHMHGERFEIQTSIHTDTQLLHSLRNFHSLWQNQQQTPECLYKFECQPGKAVRCNEETQVKTARGSVREGDGEVALHTQNGSTMWQTVSLSL